MADTSYSVADETARNNSQVDTAPPPQMTSALTPPFYKLDIPAETVADLASVFHGETVVGIASQFYNDAPRLQEVLRECNEMNTMDAAALKGKYSSGTMMFVQSVNKLLGTQGQQGPLMRYCAALPTLRFVKWEEVIYQMLYAMSPNSDPTVLVKAAKDAAKPLDESTKKAVVDFYSMTMEAFAIGEMVKARGDDLDRALTAYVSTDPTTMATTAKNVEEARNRLVPIAIACLTRQKAAIERLYVGRYDVYGLLVLYFGLDGGDISSISNADSHALILDPADVTEWLEFVKGEKDAYGNPSTDRVAYRTKTTRPNAQGALEMFRTQMTDFPLNWILGAGILKLWKTIRNTNNTIVVAYPVVPRTDQYVTGAGEEAMQSAVQGGAGGEDAASLRVAVNASFVKKFFDTQLGELNTALQSFISSSGQDVIEFLSDGSTYTLINALEAVVVPSLAYGPILSGYYRQPETKARRDRYVEALREAVKQIARYTTAPSKLGSSTANALTRSADVMKSMAQGIEESSKKMDDIFARLAAGEIREITSKDGDKEPQVDTRKIDPFEVAGYSGEAHVKLGKTIGNIKELAKRSTSALSMMGSLRRLEEYGKNAGQICDDAIKTRLEELSLTYTNLLAAITDGADRDLAMKVIKFRMETYREFYAVLKETELQLAKIHREMLTAPAIREELYSVIANWTIATRTNVALDNKFETQVKKLIKTLFGSTDSNYVIFDYSPASLTSLQAKQQKGTNGSKLYDTFRQDFLTAFSYSPQLMLLLNIVNTMEKHFKRGIDVKKLYPIMIRFIIATSVDVCRQEDALLNINAADVAAKLIKPCPAGLVETTTSHQRTEPGTAEDTVPQYGANPPNPVGVFFRHAVCKKRLEDTMFVRWVKSLCMCVLFPLDADRSMYPGSRISLPGAEKIITGGSVGGSVDDPIAIVGSTKVIVDAIPIYDAIPKIFNAYFTWASWQAPGTQFEDKQEPQLILDLPRSSRFYPISELIRSIKNISEMSETQWSKVLAACNEIWGHYSGSYPDITKRRSAIINAAIDECSEFLVLKTLLAQKEIDAQREQQTDQDAMSGIVEVEKTISAVEKTPYKPTDLARRHMEALKGIALHIFQLVNRVNTTEATMVADYGSYLDRMQKTVSDAPEADRFHELFRLVKEPDKSVGDVAGLFMAFTEFVSTPLSLLLYNIDQFVFRATNAFVLIARYLYAARIGVSIGTGTVTSAANGGIIGVQTSMARWWYVANALRAFTDKTPPGERLLKVLELMTAPVAGPTDVNLPAATIAAIGQAGGNPNTPSGTHTMTPNVDISTLRGLIQVGRQIRLPMHQPIYKAIQSLLLPDGMVTIKGNAPLSVDTGKFMAMVADSLTEIKNAMAPFIKIGDRENVHAFYEHLQGWNVGEMLGEVTRRLNLALGIVKPDSFFALREYLPNAVAPGTSVDARAATLLTHRGWYVNYRRNLIKKASDPNGGAASAAMVAYQESVRYAIGSPWSWQSVQHARTGGINGANAAMQLTENDWTGLSQYHGIFSPKAKIGGKAGVVSGYLPWSVEDMEAIEGGKLDPTESYAAAAPALNSPLLWAPLASVELAISRNDTDALNSGMMIYKATAAPATPYVTVGFSNRPTGAVAAAGAPAPNPGWVATLPQSPKTMMSTLYARPAYDSKAETFNRLMAKMISVLTIAGEEPVLLYDLCNSIVSHTNMSKYFQTTSLSIPTDRAELPMAITVYPNAIPTPVLIGDGICVLSTEGSPTMVSIRGERVPRGGVLQDADIGVAKGNAQVQSAGLSAEPPLNVDADLGASCEPAIVRHAAITKDEERHGGAEAIWAAFQSELGNAFNAAIRAAAGATASALATAKAAASTVFTNCEAFVNTARGRKVADREILAALQSSVYSGALNLDPTQLWVNGVGGPGASAWAAGGVGTTFSTLFTTLAATAAVGPAGARSMLWGTARRKLSLYTRMFLLRVYTAQLAFFLSRRQSPAQAHLTNLAGDGVEAPKYKDGTFIYDAVLFPILDSVRAQTPKRVNEMSVGDQSRYLAAIPQLVACFSDLKAKIVADKTMGVFDSNAVYGSFVDIGISGVAAATPPDASTNAQDFSFGAIPLPTPPMGGSSALPGIPVALEKAIDAVLEGLTKVYRTIRDKYGNPIHMEQMKGDFESLAVGGKFSATKLTTPLSMLQGVGQIGESGPAVVAAFAEKGGQHLEDTLCLSWMGHLAHKDLGRDTIPLDSVPWTVQLAERTKKITGASMDTILQPIVTRIAKLASLANRMNLQSIACHSTWGSQTMQAILFHLHNAEINFASMVAGHDLLYRLDVTTGAAVPPVGGRTVPVTTVETGWLDYYLPTMRRPIAMVLGRSYSDPNAWGRFLRDEPILGDTALGDGSVLAQSTIGRWATPLPPLNRQQSWDFGTATKLIYSVQPYRIEDDQKTVSLATTAQGTLESPATFATLITNAARARVGVANYYVALLERMGLTTSMADSSHGTTVAGAVPTYVGGSLLANLLHLLSAHPMDSIWLKNYRDHRWFLEKAYAAGLDHSSIGEKVVTRWTSSKQSAEDVIMNQMGYAKRGSVPSGSPEPTDSWDSNYIEIVRFSPPKGRWSKSDAVDRHTAGLFLYLKRNPIPATIVYKSVSFGATFLFSEAFDLYMQLMASRHEKFSSTKHVRAHIPTLLTNPLEMGGEYEIWGKDPTPNSTSTKAYHAGRTRIAEDATFWPGAEKNWFERPLCPVLGATAGVAHGVGEKIWQSYTPHDTQTSIRAFYMRCFKTEHIGGEAGILHPVGTTPAPAGGPVVGGHDQALISFPLFGMYVRFIDQAGIMLMQELSQRLREIKFDSPDSLAQQQKAIVGLLTQ